MDSIGMVNSINASSIMDKEQHVQQAQVASIHDQAEARALKEEQLRQTTVTNPKEGDQVRLRKDREKKRRNPAPQKDRGQPAKETVSESEDGETYQHIHITV
jgi:hypothetical protein